MKFEWDSHKAASNKRKHGVSFELAATVFDDPFALRVEDIKHSSYEERFWQLGESDAGILVVVFTIRGKMASEVYRLISARKANEKEKNLYEINRRIPI